jgi:NAD(P)-dependent dehydrogenase (short-subunit alcohol dehydrogenase family)
MPISGLAGAASTQGKILILGGTGGIGRALAKRLVSKTFQVHIVSRHENKFKEILASMPAAGGLEGKRDLGENRAVEVVFNMMPPSRFRRLQHFGYRQPYEHGLQRGTLVSTAVLGSIPFTQGSAAQVDVTDSEAVATKIKSLGNLSGLAYCVGSINLRPLKATTSQDFMDVSG